MKNAFLWVILAMGLNACFPVYKTLQPEFEVTVVDEKGNVIENAEIILLTEIRPSKKQIPNIQQYTNAQGKAAFSAQREWTVESLIIHGVQYYSWSMCVNKAGYVTQGMIDIDQDKIKVVLLPKNTNIKLSETEQVLQNIIEVRCVVE